ncbi:Periodic tryptophan protein 2-like protein [Hypsibius exemplaris]|uniref:Periodic tryptophan protein 2-like protein n=1 Tax=Hypsibius exemplaris TaxID=2072580 RepID=A0A1W0WZA3_HYPEX|nr:Periodic tryptophan protein 2-like protein [Hypsibius exemplaris]
MKFAYKFQNLLGTVYNQGNILFTPDDNTVLSPVGNRISAFDLKRNKSQTLPVECHKSFTCTALSPNGVILIAVAEDGEALVISLISKTVLHKHRFNRKVYDIQFSPDGSRFAVTFQNDVQLFTAPGQRSVDFNPFHLERVFFGSHDETTCIDWTSDSKCFAVGAKDMNTRVYPVKRCPNLGVYSLGGHSDIVLHCFFAKDSLNLYSLSRSGQLCIWACDTSLADLWVAEENEPEEPEEVPEVDPLSEFPAAKEPRLPVEEKKSNKIAYTKSARHYYRDLTKDHSTLTSACFHKTTKILVAGFSNGSFFLHEMPDFTLIHSLSLGEQSITAAVFNRRGDWLALGTTGLGQLVVWEWQSQCFVLKQQGHYDQLMTLTYSPDGQYLATGGSDGKVKLWNTSSGFCFVTFNEHTASVTALQFTHSGKAVISSSLDGTVRAFDTTRYRNFRTFTSPRPAQFSCLAIDPSGDVVCAGSQDSFELFVWSVQTGRLLEILSGHEAPISGVAFGNAGENQLLVSSSWDQTVRVWDIFKSKSQQESVRVHSEALAVAFRPDGNEIAVCDLNCRIQFFDPVSTQQIGIIEAKADLGRFRREDDLVSGKTASKGRAFTTLCYSADGMAILVGGKSKYICVYHTKEHVLLRRFAVSKNWSFTGMTEFLSKRTNTEMGQRGLMDLDEDDSDRQKLSLPGVRSGDMASRHFKPEVTVYSVQFSPTGQSWAACSTEGLMIYSTHTEDLFDPFDLDPSITPASTRALISGPSRDPGRALIMALRLNENKLVAEVMESIPVHDIALISENLPDKYVTLLLNFSALQLENSRHFEFYLNWIKTTLFAHGQKLKSRSTTIMPVLHSLQKALIRKKEDILRITQRNVSNLEYAQSVFKLTLEAGNSASDGKDSDSVDGEMEEDEED